MGPRSALAATAAIGVLLLALGATAGAQTDSRPVGRTEAISLLEPLIDKFEVELAGSRRREVAANCLQIQAAVLDPARARLPDLQTKYETFIATAGGQIWGLTNRLAAFADDASSLNLVMVELRRFRLTLGDQIEVYDRSLQTTVAINCIAYPNHFVAGLHQIRANHRQLGATIQALLDLADFGIPAALVATECHLFQPDNPACQHPPDS